MARAEKTSVGYGGLAIMLLGGMLGGLTQTAMNTTLVSVTAELGTSVAFSQWLVSVFPLCLGVVIPLSACLCRRARARTLFLSAMAIYLCGTAVIFAAHAFPLLFAGRALQGVAAGILYPILQVVVFSQFPARRRGTIMGFVGLTFGFAPNIGPTIAGAFTAAFGWRSCFLFLGAVALAVGLLGLALLPRTPAEAGDGSVDAASAALSTLAFGGVLMGLTNASSFGFASFECAVPLVVGIAAAVLFCSRQLRVEHPLLNLRVFGSRPFRVGTIALCLLFAAHIGTALAIPLELQAVHGFSALEAGMALLPGTLTAVIVNPLSGVLMDRTGPRRVTCVCALLLLAGSAALLRLGEMASLPAIMILQLIRQIGISGVIMPVNTWSLNALPPALVPDGNSLSNALRQVAAAIGTAVLVLLMAGGGEQGAVTAPGVDAAMAFACVCVAALAVLCLAYVRDEGR